jgi:hypothetical protein
MNMYHRIDVGFGGCTMRVCNKQLTFSREYASPGCAGHSIAVYTSAIEEQLRTFIQVHKRPEGRK